MRHRVAFVEEAGVRFALVEIDPALFDNAPQLNAALDHLRLEVYRGTPVVLMTRPADGPPRFQGRPDLARRLQPDWLWGLAWRDVR